MQNSKWSMALKNVIEEFQMLVDPTLNITITSVIFKFS